MEFHSILYVEMFQVGERVFASFENRERKCGDIRVWGTVVRVVEV